MSETRIAEPDMPPLFMRDVGFEAFDDNCLVMVVMMDTRAAEAQIFLFLGN